MSDSCCSDADCEVGEVGEVGAGCPKCGRVGRPVAWQTVAALTVGSVPPNRIYRLCEDPECSVVYFGPEGPTLTIEDVAPIPGFKAAGDGLVCYCYLFRRSDLERDARKGVPSRTLDAIRNQVKAGNCACEVRNPTGKCCLGAVQRELAKLEAQRSAPEACGPVAGRFRSEP